MGRTVVLIGWSGAGWAVAQPLLEQGHLPALGQAIANGVTGVLRGFAPFAPDQLAGTVLTGSHPDDLVAGRPPLWDFLASQGLRAFTSGWPEAAAPPPGLLGSAAGEALGPQELDPGLLGFFASREALARPAVARRLSVLLTWLAPVYSTHNASVIAADRGIPFIAPAYTFLHQVTQAFAPLSGDETYRQVIPGAYRLMDALLGDLMGHCPADSAWAVASDHGFTPEGQPMASGLFVARGTGLAPGTAVGRLALADVMPGLLSAAGLPRLPVARGRDWTGASPAACPPASAAPEVPEGISAASALPVGVALVDLGRPSEAVDWLHQALLQAPDSSAAAFALCRALLRAGLTAEAAHYAEAVFDAGKEAAEACLVRTELALAQVRPKEAMAWLDRLGPERATPDSEGLRRHALIQAGRGAEAVVGFGEAIRTDPFEPLLRIGLGHAELLKGDLPAARAALEAARRLDPLHPALSGLEAALAGGAGIPAFSPWQALADQAQARARIRERLEAREQRYNERRQKLRQAGEPLAYVLLEGTSRPRAGSIVVVTGSCEAQAAALLRLLARSGVAVMAQGESKGAPVSPLGPFGWTRLQELRARPSVIDRATGRALFVPPGLLASLPTGRTYQAVVLGADPIPLPAHLGKPLHLDPAQLASNPRAVVEALGAFLGRARLRWPEAAACLARA